MCRASVITAILFAAAAVAQTASGQSADMPSRGGSVEQHGSMPSAPSMHAMEPMQHDTPSMPGQDAFGAITEVVRLLDADPNTDWSKVDLERLRQHLIDMNEVVLKADVEQRVIPGGLVMDVTGTGRTERAIRAIVIPHADELDRVPEWSARAKPISRGVRLTVTAKEPEDARAVARLRGLGFIGLLTVGAHHGPHHLAIARGERVAHDH